MQEIIEYFNKKELPNKVILLSYYEKIYDVKAMVSSHISILNSNANDKFKHPFLNRLVRLKEHLESAS
jgi:hypothetical protein